MIENDLRQMLLSVASAYGSATDMALSSVSRRCRNDSGFFHRIADPTKSFTARTFDEVIQWFSENWPASVDWPAGIRRPSAEAVSVQDQPASPPDSDVVVANAAEQIDLLPEEHSDRVLPADAIRAGDAASTAPACEPADSN